MRIRSKLRTRALAKCCIALKLHTHLSLVVTPVVGILHQQPVEQARTEGVELVDQRGLSTWLTRRLHQVLGAECSVAGHRERPTA